MGGHGRSHGSSGCSCCRSHWGEEGSARAAMAWRLGLGLEEKRIGLAVDYEFQRLLQLPGTHGLFRKGQASLGSSSGVQLRLLGEAQAGRDLAQEAGRPGKLLPLDRVPEVLGSSGPACTPHGWPQGVRPPWGECLYPPA